MRSNDSQSIGETNTDKDHLKISPIVIQCACHRDITLEELARAYPDRKKNILQKFLLSLNAAMNRYDIHSCLSKAHFLAQVGHESSELRYTAEVLPKGKAEEKVYDGYKGRGLIQLTYKKNYSLYGDYINQDLLGKNRYKVEEPELACDSAGWYWKIARGEDLSTFADKNDALYITASINGAFNGYEGKPTSRLTLLKNTAKALHVEACPRLDALFSSFPEIEKFTYESFSLENSRANEIPDMAFAWGYWHDPKSKKEGTKKDIEQAKLGYKRYLELIKIHPPKRNSGRFGFKNRTQMHAIAEERSKE